MVSTLLEILAHLWPKLKTKPKPRVSTLLEILAEHMVCSIKVGAVVRLVSTLLEILATPQSPWTLNGNATKVSTLLEILAYNGKNLMRVLAIRFQPFLRFWRKLLRLLLHKGLLHRFNPS